MRKTLVMTGGGTAGHVMPNIALIPYLTSYFDNFHYIGSENGVERDIIAGFPFIKYHAVPCVKFVRKAVFTNVKIPFVLLKGVAEAKRIYKEIKPNAVFSKGGYAALPAVKATGNIPLVCHESDLSPGLTTKLSAKKSVAVCTSFENAANLIPNGVHTGAPIRDSLYRGKKLALALNDKLPVVLIVGGSLGAKAINTCINNSINDLTKKYNVLHIVGKGNSFPVQATDGIYHQFEFAENIEDFYKTADFVVSRGGSGCLFELMSLEKRALIIPLPKGRSRGDQIQNAEYFSQSGCCHMLVQDELSEQTLLSKLDDLRNDTSITSNIRKYGCFDGTKKIADIIITAAKREPIL